MKLSWLLVFKAFITLFWVLGMMVFINEIANNYESFIKYFDYFDVVLGSMIFLGCVSVTMDFFFKNKNIMVTYFLA